MLIQGTQPHLIVQAVHFPSLFSSISDLLPAPGPEVFNIDQPCSSLSVDLRSAASKCPAVGARIDSFAKRSHFLCSSSSSAMKPPPSQCPSWRAPPLAVVCVISSTSSLPVSRFKVFVLVPSRSFECDSCVVERVCPSGPVNEE